MYAHATLKCTSVSSFTSDIPLPVREAHVGQLLQLRSVDGLSLLLLTQHPSEGCGGRQLASRLWSCLLRAHTTLPWMQDGAEVERAVLPWNPPRMHIIA